MHANSSKGRFDHTDELGGLEVDKRMVNEHTFGNRDGSRKSLFEHDTMLKINEAVGQENMIIRPSGSKQSLHK